MHFLITVSLVIFCSLLICKSVNSLSCEYFENVIRGKEDTEHVLDEPTGSKNCTIGEGEDARIGNELGLSNSTIRTLKTNSVRNMPWLKAIYCLYCQIELIEAGAFQNVSNIVELIFSYNVMTEIRRGIFNVLPNLEVLDIRGNKIYNIDDEAFSNMPKLIHLNLNGNEMEYWKKEWFKNTTNIATVKFVKNNLRSIPPSAFADFRIIQNIYFDDNQITTIHRDAFKGVKYLFHLGLSNNRLIILSEAMVPNDLRIDIFDISANELNYIPSKVLKKLRTYKTFMEGNPWKCQCLNLINFWLDITGGISKATSEDPVCNGPNIPVCISTGASSCVESVDREITKRYNSHPEISKRKANRECTLGYYDLLHGEQD